MTAVHLYECDPLAELGTPVPAAGRRPLHLIAAGALKANCGECWAHPGGPCTDGVLPLGGMHLARFARARRRAAISGPDMAVVLEAAGARFESATVIPCVLAGAAS